MQGGILRGSIRGSGGVSDLLGARPGERPGSLVTTQPAFRSLLYLSSIRASGLLSVESEQGQRFAFRLQDGGVVRARRIHRELQRGLGPGVVEHDGSAEVDAGLDMDQAVSRLADVIA